MYKPSWKYFGFPWKLEFLKECNLFYRYRTNSIKRAFCNHGLFCVAGVSEGLQCNLLLQAGSSRRWAQITQGFIQLGLAKLQGQGVQLFAQLSTSGCPCGEGLNQLGFPFGSHWWCLLHTLTNLNPEVREHCSCLPQPPIPFPACPPSHQEDERKVRLIINEWGEEMQCLTCQLAISCDYSL